MNDPTKDETYEGLTLKDFVRYFHPQLEASLAEGKMIEEKGFAPLLDPDAPESQAIKNRADRRRIKRERQKLFEEGQRKKLQEQQDLKKKKLLE